MERRLWIPEPADGYRGHGRHTEDFAPGGHGVQRLAVGLLPDAK